MSDGDDYWIEYESVEVPVCGRDGAILYWRLEWTGREFIHPGSMPTD